jgi:hypothetical protein
MPVIKRQNIKCIDFLNEIMKKNLFVHAHEDNKGGPVIF